MNKAKFDFFASQVKSGVEIAAFHFNDTFCDYADKFYSDAVTNKATLKGRSIMAAFKRDLKSFSDTEGYRIVKGRTDYIDKVDFRVNVIWTLKTKLI